MEIVAEKTFASCARIPRASDLDPVIVISNRQGFDLSCSLGVEDSLFEAMKATAITKRSILPWD